MRRSAALIVARACSATSEASSAAASRATPIASRAGAGAAAAARAPSSSSAATASLSTSARASFAYGEGAAAASSASRYSRAFSPAAAAALAALAAGGAAAAVASSPMRASASAAAAPPAAAASPAAADPYAPPPSAGSRGRPTSVTLYQYEVCPFCCKVKSFLDFHRIPYRVVEVNPLTKAELKGLAAEVEAAAAAAAAKAATGGSGGDGTPAVPSLKKVPVVRLAYADGGAEDVVADSSVIISRLAAELGLLAGGGGPAAAGGWGGRGGAAAATAASAAAEDEARWRRWADERLVKTITANIYRSWDESWQTFSYITREAGDGWGWAAREGARVAGAVLMWRVGSGMPKKYGIEGDLREALYRDLDAFADAVDAGDKGSAVKGGGKGGGGGGRGKFLGGDGPNLGDLAVYGVIRAIRGTNTYNDMVAHSRILPWLQRMDVAVGEGSRIVEAGGAGGGAVAAAATAA